MDKKTSWEHVLGEPVVSAPGERTMKAQIEARFDGSFKQFAEWMETTFKNAADLRVRVIIGSFPLVNEIIPTPKVHSEHAQKLAAISTAKLTYDEAEDVVAKVWRVCLKANKIAGIKELREVTALGLKEAKEYVESLYANPPKVEDDIPF